ncbi:MAG: hypothetical protein WKG06_20625 [Segetibacter sp.]
MLDPIADRTVPATQDLLSVSLSASDPDGDPVGFTATAQSLAYVLDQQLGQAHPGVADYYLNWFDRNEKWVKGAGGAGHHPAHRRAVPLGRRRPVTGTLVGTPGASYHAQPALLHDAQPNQPHAAVSVSGDLTLDREDGFVGGVVVTVTARDSARPDRSRRVSAVIVAA